MIPQSALRGWLKRVATVRPPLVVATDFDGTLAPIAAHPDAVVLAESTRTSLAQLASVAQLAILTGRTLPDIVSHVSWLDPLWIVAEHGSILRFPAGGLITTEATSTEHAARLRRRATEIARLFPGAWAEPKRFGVALHFHDLAREAAAALRATFRMSCAAHHATLLEGRGYVEARFGKADPGTALRRVLAQVPRDAAVICAGDDSGDESALAVAAAAPNGLAVYVRSAERPTPRTHVDVIVDGPAEWLSILDELARCVDATPSTSLGDEPPSTAA